LLIELLDQTGQAVADLACEDQSDGIAAELSDKATFLTRLARGVRIGNVQRVERAGELVPRLRTRLEVIRRDRQAARQDAREDGSSGETMDHDGTFLLVKYTDWETIA
jgi:hypothetical protein